MLALKALKHRNKRKPYILQLAIFCLDVPLKLPLSAARWRYHTAKETKIGKCTLNFDSLEFIQVDTESDVVAAHVHMVITVINTIMYHYVPIV